MVTHLSRKTTSNLGAFGLAKKESRIMSNAIFPFSAVVTWCPNLVNMRDINIRVNLPSASPSSRRLCF